MSKSYSDIIFFKNGIYDVKNRKFLLEIEKDHNENVVIFQNGIYDSENHRFINCNPSDYGISVQPDLKIFNENEN